MIGQISSTLLVGKFEHDRICRNGQILIIVLAFIFFCRRAESVGRTPKHQKKRHQLVHPGNSTIEADKKKKISCYVLATVQLIPRVVDFLVYLFTYAPKMLGLDNSSCVPDEYTDFDVIQTPPNKARGTMHYTSCWAFIYRLRSL